MTLKTWYTTANEGWDYAKKNGGRVLAWMRFGLPTGVAVLALIIALNTSRVAQVPGVTAQPKTVAFEPRDNFDPLSFCQSASKVTAPMIAGPESGGLIRSAGRGLVTLSWTDAPGQDIAHLNFWRIKLDANGGPEVDPTTGATRLEPADDQPLTIDDATKDCLRHPHD